MRDEPLNLLVEYAPLGEAGMKSKRPCSAFQRNHPVPASVVLRPSTSAGEGRSTTYSIISQRPRSQLPRPLTADLSRRASEDKRRRGNTPSLFRGQAVQRPFSGSAKRVHARLLEEQRRRLKQECPSSINFSAMSGPVQVGTFDRGSEAQRKPLRHAGARSYLGASRSVPVLGRLGSTRAEDEDLAKRLERMRKIEKRHHAAKAAAGLMADAAGSKRRRPRAMNVTEEKRQVDVQAEEGANAESASVEGNERQLYGRPDSPLEVISSYADETSKARLDSFGVRLNSGAAGDSISGRCASTTSAHSSESVVLLVPSVFSSAGPHSPSKECQAFSGSDDLSPRLSPAQFVACLSGTGVTPAAADSSQMSIGIDMPPVEAMMAAWHPAPQLPELQQHPVPTPDTKPVTPTETSVAHKPKGSVEECTEVPHLQLGHGGEATEPTVGKCAGLSIESRARPPYDPPLVRVHVQWVIVPVRLGRASRVGDACRGGGRGESHHEEKGERLLYTEDPGMPASGDIGSRITSQGSIESWAESERSVVREHGEDSSNGDVTPNRHGCDGSLIPGDRAPNGCRGNKFDGTDNSKGGTFLSTSTTFATIADEAMPLHHPDSEFNLEFVSPDLAGEGFLIQSLYTQLMNCFDPAALELIGDGVVSTKVCDGMGKIGAKDERPRRGSSEVFNQRVNYQLRLIEVRDPIDGLWGRVSSERELREAVSENSASNQRDGEPLSSDHSRASPGFPPHIDSTRAEDAVRLENEDGRNDAARELWLRCVLAVAGQSPTRIDGEQTQVSSDSRVQDGCASGDKEFNAEIEMTVGSPEGANSSRSEPIPRIYKKGGKSKASSTNTTTKSGADPDESGVGGGGGGSSVGTGGAVSVSTWSPTIPPSIPMAGIVGNKTEGNEAKLGHSRHPYFASTPNDLPRFEGRGGTGGGGSARSKDITKHNYYLDDNGVGGSAESRWQAVVRSPSKSSVRVAEAMLYRSLLDAEGQHLERRSQCVDRNANDADDDCGRDDHGFGDRSDSGGFRTYEERIAAVPSEANLSGLRSYARACATVRAKSSGTAGLKPTQREVDTGGNSSIAWNAGEIVTPDELRVIIRRGSATSGVGVASAAAALPRRLIPPNPIPSRTSLTSASIPTASTPKSSQQDRVIKDNGNNRIRMGRLPSNKDVRVAHLAASPIRMPPRPVIRAPVVTCESNDYQGDNAAPTQKQHRQNHRRRRPLAGFQRRKPESLAVEVPPWEFRTSFSRRLQRFSAKSYMLHNDEARFVHQRYAEGQAPIVTNHDLVLQFACAGYG